MTDRATMPKRPLRIGINALYLIPGGVGGTEIYLRTLIAALAEVDAHNEYFVFRNAETAADIVPAAANFHDRPQPVHAVSRPARLAFEQTRLIADVERIKLDLLFNGGFTAPLFCRVPMLTMFYDLQYKKHPQYARWFDRPFWSTLLPASAWRSRRIVTLSEAAKADLEHFYPWTKGRIDLVPPGVERAFVEIAQRRSIPANGRPTILAVSTLHPHKNIDTLLRAFLQFSQRHPAYRLVVCGLKGFETERILRLQKELGLEDRVEFTGWIPRAELLDHFAHAEAFVYPSRFEGFGIPVLEALTAGIPTACSDIAPLREIAGDGARYFDPGDHDAIADALEDVTHDEGLRRRLAADGPARAALFSWQRSALLLKDAFEAVASPASKAGEDPRLHVAAPEPRSSRGAIRIAAIVLNYNGIEHTRIAVRSLLDITGLDVVPMVIDNGSVRDEARVLQAEFPEIVVERSEENLGFSRGVNRVARSAIAQGATHLLLMNSDAWFTGGTHVLERLLETLASDPCLAAVGPVICNPDGSTQSAGYRTSMWWPIPRSLRLGKNGRPAESPSFISGSCMLIDAERFAELGGFDPDFFLYGEDLDFALRARAAGLEVGVVRDVSVWHTRGASSRIYSERYIYTVLRGNLIVIRKHARWFQVPSAMLALALASAGLSLLGMRAGNGRAFHAAAKAWTDFFAMRWSGLQGERLTPAERPSARDLVPSA